MSIFERRKKQENTSCCCGGDCTPQGVEKTVNKKTEEGIKILGTGCAKCNALEAAAAEALRELNMEDEIDHITDFAQIASYGVMSTPALVVDGRVVSYGKVLKTKEVVEILKRVRS